NAQRTRDTLPHRRDVRRQSGLLCDHRSVDVPDLVPRLTNERKRSPEQVDAARVLPLRVVWREVLPDVAESRRAQKRIDDRVQTDVRIAVPGEPDLMRQLHAAKNEIARLIAAVDVVADAYAHGRKINGGAGCRPRGLSPFSSRRHCCPSTTTRSRSDKVPLWSEHRGSAPRRNTLGCQSHSSICRTPELKPIGTIDPGVRPVGIPKKGALHQR